MTGLYALLPAAHALACYRRIDALARRWAGDGRTLDQRRADALVYLVCGPDPDHPDRPAAPKVDVQVTIDLATLLGLRDHPGELDGHGSLPAPIARALAADGTWRRLVYDPVDGHLLDYGTTRYTPPPRLAAYIRARDHTCRFPASTRRTRHADLDHIIPFRQGGPTSATNLAALSRRAHRRKTFAGWRLCRTGTNLTWTSPLGRTYTVPPHDYRPDP